MTKVLCPGEILIDFFCMDKGVKLERGTHFLKQAGGASANVAIAVKKLGAESVFLGAVGTDPFGDFLVNTLRKYNASISGVQQIHTNTTLAFVSLTEDGERDFSFIKGAASEYEYDMIPSEVLEEASIIHFGSAMAFMGDKLQQTYYRLLQYALDNNILIVFDPNYRSTLFEHKKDVFIEHSKKFISKSHIVKVSEEEVLLITNENSIESAANRILELGAMYVMVTLGKRGTLLAHKDRIEYIPVTPVKMVDATGAGDAFIGAVLTKLVQTKNLSFDSMKSIVKFGNIVGSITVQQVGALESIPTIDML